jgi:hypothetical protein
MRTKLQAYPIEIPHPAKPTIFARTPPTRHKVEAYLNPFESKYGLQSFEVDASIG